MLGILANDTDNPVPLYHLAFVANWFNTRPDFHPQTPLNIVQNPFYEVTGSLQTSLV